MVRVPLPDNSLTATEEITKVATWEHFDPGIINNELFGLDELKLEPHSTFFERAGHNSTLFLDNIGLTIYIFYAFLICQLF